jgi:hypothetical protein
MEAPGFPDLKNSRSSDRSPILCNESWDILAKGELLFVALSCAQQSEYGDAIGRPDTDPAVGNHRSDELVADAEMIPTGRRGIAAVELMS